LRSARDGLVAGGLACVNEQVSPDFGVYYDRYVSTHRRRHSIVQELAGACGDLSTFILHVIGALTVAGLAPAGVLFGFAAFLIATGLFYGLPLPVQPMKAMSAVIVTGGLRPGEVAAAGIMIDTVLLVLGITGWIARLARAIPQSVSAGFSSDSAC
jgi:Molybdate transporter of MFS superfamily